MKKNLLLSSLLISANLLFSQFTVYNTSNSGLNDNNAYICAQDGAGNVWVGTNVGGLNKFDGANWSNFTTSNSGIGGNFIKGLEFRNSDVWAGTYGSFGGVSVYNGSTWTTHNDANSNICGDDILCIAREANGTMWVATRFTGLSKFDGTNWTCFNTSNSSIPSDEVYQVEVDPAGGVWVGFPLIGFAKFDGVSTWTPYSTSNSPLPNNDIYSIKYNTVTNSLWIGTNGGVAVKTGSNWAVYTTTNTNFPGNYVRGIAHHYPSGNTWIAAGNGGIGKWSNSTWTKYNTSNSNLPSNLGWWIISGQNNKIWAATYGGGLVSINDIPTEVNELANNSIALNVYPNPACASAQMYIASETDGDGIVTIYDNTGREVLKRSVKIVSNIENKISLDIESLSSGFYSCSLQFNNTNTTRKLIIQK